MRGHYAGVSTLRPLILPLLTLGVLSATSASAQTGFQIPSDYINRLSSTELAASNDSGFGVRYFPLPFQADIRISLMKQPKYWEYNFSTRQKDTTLAFGVFNNGATAATGVPKFEITHDPWKGLQYAGVVQHLTGILPNVESYDPFSKFTVGYAFTMWEERIRILNNVGLGYKTITNDTAPYAITSEVFAPYTQSEIGLSYNKAVTPQFTPRIYTVARLYTFPLQKQYQASIDLTPGVHFSPGGGVDLDLSQLERFATTAPVPIGDLNFARYQETYFTGSYRLPKSSSDFSVGMLRTRLTKNWVGDNGNTYLRNDVLFDVKAIPVLVGPSIGYRWANTAGGGNGWLISFSSAGK